MSNPLPDPPEQPQEEKISKPETTEKNKIFLAKPNYLFQNCFYIAALALSITALSISIISFRNANKQFKINSERSERIFKIQSENEKMIITNLEKMQEQSETQFKNQSDLTSTQIDITERLLRDQINSGAPQIIVKSATIKDKNFKIEEKYATFIDLEFRNSGNRNAYNVLARFYALTEDFKAVYEEIGYAGDKYFIGTNQENGYFITFKFNTQITSFYFCYEITYIDKFTGEKDGYTVFNLLKNNHGQDMFEGCSNQLSNKLRNLINSVLINNHKNILYE